MLLVRWGKKHRRVDPSGLAMLHHGALAQLLSTNPSFKYQIWMKFPPTQHHEAKDLRFRHLHELGNPIMLKVLQLLFKKKQF